MGGLGLRAASSHAPAAYLSSSVLTAPLVDNILRSYLHRHSLDLSLSIYRLAAGNLSALQVESLLPDSGDFSQKHLSYLIDSNLLSTLQNEVQSAGDQRSSARLLSLPTSGRSLLKRHSKSYILLEKGRKRHL